MKFSSLIANGLMSCSVCAILAACSGGGSVQNAGTANSVTVNAGGGGGASGANEVNFIPAGFTCPNGTAAGTFTSGKAKIKGCVITGEILANTTLPGSVDAGGPVAYILDGTVFVGENSISNPTAVNATLTIGAGAIILGQTGEDALVVNPGSKIEAIGTATNPIIMTSASDAADGNVSDGLISGSATTKGAWGGLIINGLAKINDCDVGSETPGTAACNKTGEGGSGLFGGADDADDSGALSYVRVQYAGFRFNGEDELNGIALQGVGSGTDVQYIQVHNGNDDGVEFFGGTVSAKYVVVTGADDDSIDWTDGWRGDLQYALIVQDDISADRGIEADNRGNDTNVGDAQGVRSMPNVSNFTLVGSSESAASPSDGIKLRAGTGGVIANGVVTGFGLGDGLDYDRANDIGGNTIVVTTATPDIFSIYVSENLRPFDTDGAVLFNAAGSNNVVGAVSTLNGLFAGPAERGVTPTDIAGSGNTLDADALFLGAFDYRAGGDTPDANWATGWTLPGTIPGAADPACPAGTALSADAVPSGRPEALVCNLPNAIETDMTLSVGNLYKFSGSVFIGDDLGPDATAPKAGASAALTIQPGVTIYGENGEDAIIVNRGSKLIAQGTQTAPIVITSESDVLGTLKGSEKGEFGGVVINGRAPINDCDVGTNVPGSIGCEKTGEGGSGLFGGNDPADNSGVLSYVQVRYAGFRFNGEDELNGVAFQGVGSGTQVDHVHVHNGNDDGFEFYGGSVDAKYLIVTGADDDSIDWTDGWRGSIQYALVIQDNTSADRGFEGDSRSNDPNVGDAQGVRSFPVVSNFSLFGSKAAAASPSDGMKLRAGTDGIFLNGIVVGFLDDGIDYDIKNNIGGGTVVSSTATPELFSIYAADNDGGNTDSDADTIFTRANRNVDGGTVRNLSGFIPNATLQGAVVATDQSTLTYPVFGDGADNNAKDLDVTDYIGAFDPASETNDDNWTTGWSFNVNTSLANVN